MCHKIELLTERVISTAVLYKILKQLTTPFDQWKAFDLGIIDKDGNILKRRATLNSTEKRTFDQFNLFIRNIKRIIEKLPGGKSRISTYLAGLFLLREQSHSDWYLTEDMVYEGFMDFYEVALDDPELEEVLKDYIHSNFPELEEDAPANSVGTGAHVAGLTEPVVRTTPKERKKNRRKFKEYI